LEQAKQAKKKLDRVTAMQNLGLFILQTIDGMPFAPGNNTLQFLTLSGNALGDDHLVAIDQELEKFKSKLETHLKKIKIQRLLLPPKNKPNSIFLQW
jgi:hypothetical protein